LADEVARPLERHRLRRAAMRLLSRGIQ
jgi:hypothetical protein